MLFTVNCQDVLDALNKAHVFTNTKLDAQASDKCKISLPLVDMEEYITWIKSELYMGKVDGDCS